MPQNESISATAPGAPTPETTEGDSGSNAVSAVDVILQMMTTVKSTVAAVASKFKASPMYTTFIEFEINGVKIRTSNDPSESIAMSLVNKRNGSGEANTFTLIVAFAPNFSTNFDPNSFEIALMGDAGQFVASEDPTNYLKCKLQYGYGDSISLRTACYEGLLLDYECDCQDGILIYTLTGYSGLSTYTETRDALTLTEIVEAFTEDDGEGEGEEGEETPEGEDVEAGGDVPVENNPPEARTPTGGEGEGEDSGEGEGEEGEEGEEDTEDSSVEAPTAVDEARTKVKAQPTVAAQYIIEKYLPEYTCMFGKIANESVLGSDESTELTTQLDKNPMKALTDILNKAVHKEQAKSLKENKTIPNDRKIKYSWFVSDDVSDGNKPKICIYAYDPSTVAEAQAAFTFNWGQSITEGYNGLVLSFKPNFKGSSLLGLWNLYKSELASNLQEGDGGEGEGGESEGGGESGVNAGISAEAPSSGGSNDSSGESTGEVTEEIAEQRTSDTVTGIGTYFLKDDGSIGVAEETSAAISGGDFDTVTANIEQLRSSWIDAVQFPYGATLTTMGIPCEIPISGVININAFVGYNSSMRSRIHHTSGNYMVQSVEDTIDASGFRTQWNLFKLNTLPLSDILDNTLPSQMGTSSSEAAEDDDSSSTSFADKLMGWVDSFTEIFTG